MTPLALLLTQIGFSFAALGTLALRLRPWARRTPTPLVVELLLWLHVPRHVALGLLAPGQATGVAASVARTIAWGDFTCAVLALVAIVALRVIGPRVLRWLWLFGLVSWTDIALALAVGLGAGVYATPLGVGWFVLTAYVPLVCISQAALTAIGAGRRAPRPLLAATQGSPT